MQVELKQLQRELGITFIFVTHDQEEALTLSDRIAVFNAGRIEQLGSPSELYERPNSTFVANFVGTSNLFSADEAATYLGHTGTCSIRPEHLDIAPGEAADGLPGTIAEVIYLGSAHRIIVDLDGGKRVTVLDRANQHRADRGLGDRVTVRWNREQLISLAS
ncbi:MAG TPA: ABC transporter ATP-binding protein [Microbacteriaceae bacterium]|nr:ABC transporter ATP-binding protein [Microbacteriaceae bacterium]